jgi:hypothetical protein
MAVFEKGYALIIGIANYLKGGRLPATVLKDAEDMSVLLMDATQCGYPPDQVKHLSDAQATANNIRAGLRWLAEQTGEDDTATFFFSGHGGRIESGPRSENYLIPYDADPTDLPKTAIEGAELTSLLRNIKAGRLLVVFDCCHAGGTGETKGALDEVIPKFKSGLDERYYERLARGQGRVIVASSRSTEMSWILPGMQNSLFTHYLLEALRGKARTYGDGWIGVLDVFNLIAEEVPKRQAQQHPILKAELETNFPIALRRDGEQSHRHANNQPAVENPGNLPLPVEARAVLKAMFDDHQRVIIEKEFGGGFGGGKVFLVRPIRSNDLPELPAVVKMASVSLIQKEWQAYQDCIRDRWPNSVGVRGVPILPPGSAWGGLRYPLVGSGTFEIESLRSYCRDASLEDIRFVLEERLLKIVEQVMQYNHFSPAFYLQASYDYMLPVNLLIRPASVPPAMQPCVIKPAVLPDPSLKRGDYVRLEDFVITKVDLEHQTVTLDLPPSPEKPSASYCVRLQSVGPMASYQVNQVIDPIEGVVTESRDERLKVEAQRALGPSFNLESKTMTMPDGTELPNPLLAPTTILSKYRDVRVGCIHGDLNLENILVDPATRDVSLIDFAAARQDHLLHDFLRLETEIVIKLIPETLANANLAAGVIRPFYDRLHKTTFQPDRSTLSSPLHHVLDKPFAMLLAIRKMASRYLFKPDDWEEYYQGLVLYLLGALKFKNLDLVLEAPLPKQVAFWGAATVVGLMEIPLSLKSDGNLVDDKEREIKIPQSESKSRPKRIIKIHGAEGTYIAVAGDTLAENVPPGAFPRGGEVADIEVELKDVKGGKHEIAGENILRYNQPSASPFDELANLLSMAPIQQDQIDDLQEIAAELKAQAAKPVPERNQSKIEQLLSNINTYLELASLTNSQVEQAQNLLTTVKGLLRK